MIRIRALRLVPLLLAFSVACDTTSEPEVVDAVLLTPAVVELAALGATRQLEAQVVGRSGDAMDEAEVSWSSTDASVATVDAAGLVTAVGNGSAGIVASSGGVSATATITVQQIVRSISFGEDTIALNYAGAERTLVAVARDALGNPVEGAVIVWRSSAPQTVSVTAGVVRALTAGTARVIAQASNGVLGTIVVWVNRRAASVIVSTDAESIQAGQTMLLTATVLDSANFEISDAVVTWSSGSPGVASVTEAYDLVAIVAGVEAGVASITATSEGVEGSASIVVLPFLPVADLEITPDSAVLGVGGQAAFWVTLRDAEGNVLGVADHPITWTSSSPGTVSVWAEGASADALAHALGTATLIATSGGASDTVTVRVAPPCATSTAISPGQTIAGSLAPGDCSALGVHYDLWMLTVPAGTAMGLRIQASASDFDASLALEDPYGEWLGYAEDPGPGDRVRLERWFMEGTHIIRVSSVAPATGSYSLSALTVPAASVTLAPDSTVIRLGWGFAFTATLRDAEGDVMDPALGTVTYTSSAPGIVAVQGGWVQGVALGTASIIATANGHADTAQVRVATCGGAMAVGGTVQGELSTSDCAYPVGNYFEVWTVNLPAGGTLVIDLSSADFNTSLVVADDYGYNSYEDAGSDHSSRVEAFFYAGTVTIYVRSSTPGATGDFTLSVRVP